MAAGLGINFEALPQDDARGLPPLLFAQAFPSPPDFSGWDAADAALAELTEVLSSSINVVAPAMPSLVFGQACCSTRGASDESVMYESAGSLPLLMAAYHKI